MSHPYSQEYNPNVNFQYFPIEYFSGCDVHIFIGDEWVSEIIRFEYSVQSNVMPIYNYAKYTANKIHMGAMLVNGQFMVNKRGAYNIYNILYKNIDPIERDKSKVNANTLDSLTPTQISELDSTEILSISGNLKSRWGWDEIAKQEKKESKAAVRSTKSTGNNITNINQDDAIKIIYGRVSDFSNTSDESDTIANNLTLIDGITINSVAEAIDTSGQPIGMMYGFIAKDISFGFNSQIMGF